MGDINIADGMRLKNVGFIHIGYMDKYWKAFFLQAMSQVQEYVYSYT